MIKIHILSFLLGVLAAAVHLANPFLPINVLVGAIAGKCIDFYIKKSEKKNPLMMYVTNITVFIGTYIIITHFI